MPPEPVSQSLFAFLGWPDGVVAALFITSFALMLSPVFGGQDIGGMTIPRSSRRSPRKALWIGCVLFVLCVAAAWPGLIEDGKPYWIARADRAREAEDRRAAEAEAAAEAARAKEEAAEKVAQAEAQRLADERAFCTSPQAEVALTNLNVKAQSGGGFSPDFRTFRHLDKSSRCRVTFGVTWAALSGHVFLPPLSGNPTDTVFFYEKDRFGFTNNSPIYRPALPEAPSAPAWSEVEVSGQARGDSGTSDDTCGGQVTLNVRQVPAYCLPHLSP